MWREYKMGKRLKSVGYIAMWLYSFMMGSDTSSLLFKEQRQKKLENGFLEPTTRTSTSLPQQLNMSNSWIICSLFVSVSHQSGLDTRSMTWRLIIVGIEGRGRLGMSRDPSPAGLCWSSAHLVQCGPDEPSWTWTQI